MGLWPFVDSISCFWSLDILDFYWFLYQFRWTIVLSRPENLSWWSDWRRGQLESFSFPPLSHLPARTWWMLWLLATLSIASGSGEMSRSGDENCSNSQTRLNYWKGESWILKWWLGSSCPHGTLSTGALSCVAADSVIHEMEPDTFGKEQVLFDLLPTPIFLLPPHNNQYSLLNPGVWSHHPIVAFYLTVVVLSVVYLIFH